MAILRSLRTLARRNPNSRTFFPSLAHSSPSTPFPSSQPLSSIFSHRSSNLLSPLSKWVPFPHGPLFLSCQPWKLAQFSTPLYFQSEVLEVPKVRALDLLRAQDFPINLGLRLESASSGTNLRNEDNAKKVNGCGGLVESFVNLPNLISMCRLLSGPLLGWMIVQEMYLPAFVGLVISGATDWLDGYVARKMGMNSVVGSYLDPLADKVLIGCVALAMVDKGLLHSGLVGLIVMRDVALIGGAIYKRASDLDWEWRNWFYFFNLDGTRPQKIEPLFLSKVNTAFQLVLVTAVLLQPEFGTLETESYITYLSWLVASTTVASTAAYGAKHLTSRSTSVRKTV